MSRRALLVLSVLALAASWAAFLWWPREAATGWLIAFVYCSGIVLGSLAWAMVHRVTGGNWFAALEPMAGRLMTIVPAILVAFVPIALSFRLIFDWQDLRLSVGALWLNDAGYIARSVILLGLLAGLAFWLRLNRASLLLPAVGLCLYGLAINVFGVDWILAVHRETMFTAFGAFLAVEQLATAMSFAILMTPLADEQVREDLAQLLLAIVLGTLYLGFMDFFVTWYGDVPDRVAWYVTRSSWPWFALLLVALLLGAALPLAALLASRTRFVVTLLKPACAAILLGALSYDAWLVAPASRPSDLLVAGLAVFALGGLIVVVARTPEWSTEAAHG